MHMIACRGVLTFVSMNIPSLAHHSMWGVVGGVTRSAMQWISLKENTVSRGPADEARTAKSSVALLVSQSPMSQSVKTSLPTDFGLAERRDDVPNDYQLYIL